MSEPFPAESRLLRTEGVARLLAIGDVQSNYEPLLALLAEAGFASLRDGVPVWTGGVGTLLFMGDLLDGGPRPAEVLWLVMRLHEQAALAGGQVILVQGNHELMLFDAAADAGEAALTIALARWFANGGLETLLRLAASVGIAVPQDVVARMFTAVLEAPEHDPELRALARAVGTEYAPELGFLKAHARAAVLVNGAVLAVHGSPNFEAASLDAFVRDARDEVAIAWSRGWLEDWEPGAQTGPFVERLASLKQRCDDAGAGVALRCLLFAHTPLPEYSVPGFRDRQFRIGRLTVAEAPEEVPAVFDLLTAPREVPQGGALGGLLVDASGVTAVYGAEIASEDQILPARERLDERRLLEPLAIPASS